jgi:choline dehydrogenase-like flavoprotein
LRANATAFEITVAPDGRARSVRYLDAQRRESEVLARHIVVSGNAVGTPQLLLSSKSARFPDGLANTSGLVGRNLTYHHFAYVGYFANEPTLTFTGLETHAAIDDLHASDSRRGFIRGGVIADMNMGSKQPIAYALVQHPGYEPAKRGWGASYKKYLRQFPRAGGILSVLEDVPVESNRVDLDPEVKDALGLPAPRITHKQHPNDVAMNRWYAERQLEMADAAGAVEKWVVSAPEFAIFKPGISIKGSAHFHGTCRMGDVPSRSVVDRFCRAHDVPNLWVVDGSVFPTAGGYNPTLTILANAYRVADHFVRAGKHMEL